MNCANLPMLKPSKAFLLISFAALFILASDLLTMRYKVLYGGDEIISYLCATGNSGEYEAVLHKYAPYGKLVDASEWIRYTNISSPNCFNKIATDLSLNDLHPPLYFWLLHLFVLNFGVNIFTGILLNLILQLASLFFVFKLASLLFEDKNKGAFTALLWALSPACVMVSLNARPYELLELISIIYLLNFFLWYKNATRINALLLAMIGSIGLLTNYTFIYLIASCGLFTLINYKTSGWRNISAFIVAAFIAFESMTMIHPSYAHSFMLQHSRAQTFNIHELPMRILKSVLSFIEFFIPVLSLKQPGITISMPFVVILTLVLVVILLLLYLFFKPIKLLFTDSFIIKLKSIYHDQNLKIFFSLFSILSCAILIPYFLFITPFHAMGGQYLVLLYPLIAIVVSAFIFSISNKFLIFFPGIFFTGSICVLGTMIWWNQHNYIHLIEDLQKSKVVIVTDMDRRAFPRLIPYLKPGQKVLMNENATTVSDSLNNILNGQTPVMIINGKKSGNREIKYDTNDGIIFYTTLIP